MNRKLFWIIPASIMLLSSCGNEDNPSNTGSGLVNLSVNVDSEIITASDDIDGRSADVSAPKIEDFKIKMQGEGGGYSHQWNSIADFPTDEQFKIGRYRMEAFYGSLEDEGFEKPYYYGSSDFAVTEASVTNVSVTCGLANTMVSIDYTEAFKGYFTDYSTELHSDGGAYILYAKDETRPAYLRPGNVSMTISLTLPSGMSTTFQPASIVALARHHYHVTMDVNSGNMGTAQLVIKFDETLATEDITIDLSDELMSSPAPEITTEGFIQGEIVSVKEGQQPENPVKMVINARAGIASVVLTTSSSSLIADGFPAEIDLMSATAQEQAFIEQMGLSVDGLWRNPDKIAQLDFTNLLGRLRYDVSRPTSTFTIAVKDKLTKFSEPVSLNVEIIPADVQIEGAATATIGDNTTQITVACESREIVDKLTIEACNDLGEWQNVNVSSITEKTDGANRYEIAFSVPDGVVDVPVRVKYMGAVKAETMVMRLAPKFDIKVDAFANQAVVKIVPEKASQLAFLTHNVTIVADNSIKNVISRDEENGTVTITGLNPTTNYSIKATVMAGNANPEYCESVKITTEKTLSIPNGDFEEIDDLIDYEGLYSGGRYSSSTVAIMNQQNQTTLNVDFPEGWTSVNAKTFCFSANNKNSWYMQPSSMSVTDTKQSGTKSVKIASVAWDINGEPVSDYIQEGTPYVKYNRNVPNIAYRAAGKMFLGEYVFDASTVTERYNEGISFASRPSALNGYFKYVPSAADYEDNGLVVVSVIGIINGKETIIANERLMLSATSDFTAFSLPIKYNHFGVKAVAIQVMFASSDTIGTISEETATIKTVADCASASSVGSVLWIDNLSFSY